MYKEGFRSTISINLFCCWLSLIKYYHYGVSNDLHFVQMLLKVISTKFQLWYYTYSYLYTIHKSIVFVSTYLPNESCGRERQSKRVFFAKWWLQGQFCSKLLSHHNPTFVCNTKWNKIIIIIILLIKEKK